MERKLMLVTISGVQEFIAKSRKIADFLNGSRIIGDYLKNIHDILNKKCSLIKDFKVLLPAAFIEFEIENNYPNYFIAEFNGIEDEDKLRTCIRENLSLKYKIICESLNVYIVIVDYGNDYYEAYKNLYKKLDTYKNDRFKDNSFAIKNENNESKNNNRKAEKCSICGVNDGIRIFKNNVYHGEYNGQDIPFDSGDDYEILCESCYRRRKYKSPGRVKFESVIEIGPIEWKNKVKKTALSEYEQKINKLKKKANQPLSQLYYKDYLIKNNIDKKYVEELKKLCCLNNGQEIKPSKYYALIKADIDGLGKHFSGKYLEEKNELLNFQKKLSDKISNLGSKVEESLDKVYVNKKLCIYAGGDDILFFCPLYKVFDCIRRIDDYLTEVQLENYDGKITMSKSVVISHSTIPLKKVINLSRTSLETAKETFKNNDKDAIAISLINSSAAVLTTYLKNKGKIISLLKDIINGFKNHISRSLIYTMEKQFYLLGENMTFNEYDILHNVIENLIKRVCDRKISGSKEEKQKYADDLEKVFYEFVDMSSTNYYINIKGYFNLLHILDKYSREIIDEL